MVQTLIGLGMASLAGMVVSKILEETGKMNWAQYVSMTTSAFLGGTAVAGVVNLFNTVSKVAK